MAWEEDLYEDNEVQSDKVVALNKFFNLITKEEVVGRSIELINILKYYEEN